MRTGHQVWETVPEFGGLRAWGWRRMRKSGKGLREADRAHAGLHGYMDLITV